MCGLRLNRIDTAKMHTHIADNTNGEFGMKATIQVASNDNAR